MLSTIPNHESEVKNRTVAFFTSTGYNNIRNKNEEYFQIKKENK